jgi:hypothetical protein
LRSDTHSTYEVAELPSDTWSDGVFNFDDYLTESVHAGVITTVEDSWEEQ